MFGRRVGREGRRCKKCGEMVHIFTTREEFDQASVIIVEYPISGNIVSKVAITCKGVKKIYTGMK